MRISCANVRGFFLSSAFCSETCIEVVLQMYVFFMSLGNNIIKLGSVLLICILPITFHIIYMSFFKLNTPFDILVTGGKVETAERAAFTTGETIIA